MVMLLLSSLTSCKPDDEVLIIVETKEVVESSTAEPGAVCMITEDLSDWFRLWAIGGSGFEKFRLDHTEALKTMARTGDITHLDDELRCLYSVKRVTTLRTGGPGDINNIGFAPQTLYANQYIVAMYHPNNYPDHFVVYDTVSGDWWRFEESTLDQGPYLTNTN